MSHATDVPYPPPPPEPVSAAELEAEPDWAHVPRHEAGDVTDQGTSTSRQVAGTAKEEAANVLSETKDQTRDLIGQGREEIRSQAASQQERAAGGLRAIADELRSMAISSPEQGLAADLARQAAQRADSAASWLGEREPGQVLDEARAFARRRPALFLGIAVSAGIVAGRLGRGLKEGPLQEGPVT